MQGTCRSRQLLPPQRSCVRALAGIQQLLHMLCDWKVIPEELRVLSPSAVTLPCRWPRKEQRVLEAPSQSPVRGCERSPHSSSLLHLWSGADERAVSQLQNSRYVHHTSICLWVRTWPPSSSYSRVCKVFKNSFNTNKLSFFPLKLVAEIA